MTQIKTFSQAIFTMWQVKDYKERKNFTLVYKNYLLEMPCSHAKICLKSAPEKLNFLKAKDMSKSYTLDCSCKFSCTFLYSYT